MPAGARRLGQFLVLRSQFLVVGSHEGDRPGHRVYFCATPLPRVFADLVELIWFARTDLG